MSLIVSKNIKNKIFVAFLHHRCVPGFFLLIRCCFPATILTVWTTLGCDLPGGEKSRHTAVRSLCRRRRQFAVAHMILGKEGVLAKASLPSTAHL
jgi:hypothetical protein